MERLISRHVGMGAFIQGCCSMSSRPEHVTLTAEEAQALKTRVQAAPLPEKDIKLIIGLGSVNDFV